jgi:hypothetical protein
MICKQLLLVGLQIRQMRICSSTAWQVLRLVDDEHGVRLQREQAEQEVVKRLDQLLLRDVRQAAALHVFARDDAEVLQDQCQQILFGQKRVEYERGERVPVDLFEQRRHSVVLPVPMSPVTTRKPSRRRMAYWRSSKALACDSLLKRYFGSGVRLNGFS